MAKSKIDLKTLKPATRLIATARDYSEHGVVSPAVYHASTILALTRIPVRAGEIMVLTPQGEGRFAVAGRFIVP